MCFISSLRLKQQDIFKSQHTTYVQTLLGAKVQNFILIFYASNLEVKQFVCVSICQKIVKLLESTCMFLNNAMDFCREMETCHFWLIFEADLADCSTQN